MCGIVGYIGFRQVQDVLLSGFFKFEYCGYDSVGVVVGDGVCIVVCKKVGKFVNFVGDLQVVLLSGSFGIGYICWVIYGLFNDCNSYFYIIEDGCIVLVYNGIIENYLLFKEELFVCGYIFKSDIDFEVVVYLIEEVYQGNFEEVVQVVLVQVCGVYVFVVIYVDYCEIVVVCIVFLLVMGVGEGEMFLVLDVFVLFVYIWQMVFLMDGDMVIFSDDGYCVIDL